MGYIIKNITKNKLSVGIGGRPLSLSPQETLIIKGNSYPVSLRKLEVKRFIEVNYVSDDVITMYYNKQTPKKVEEVKTSSPKQVIIETPSIVSKSVETENNPLLLDDFVTVDELLEEPTVDDALGVVDTKLSNGETKKNTKKKSDK